jgi:hypothetical protein
MKTILYIKSIFRLIDYLLIFILLMFSFIEILLLGSILLSFKIFLDLFIEIYRIILANTIQSSSVVKYFISPMASLVELFLFDIILILISVAIYLYIIKPIFSEDQDFEFDVMFQKFFKFLSQPFLTVLSSILIISIFKITIDVYYLLTVNVNLDNLFFNLNFLFIFYVFISIISISIVLLIEHKIQR